MKLFDEFPLNKRQKISILENFDRANNEKEIRLVYHALREGFNTKNNKKKYFGFASSKTCLQVKEKLDEGKQYNDQRMILPSYKNISKET